MLNNRGDTDPPPFFYAPPPHDPRRTAGVRGVFILLSYLTGFVCGAAVIGLVWLSSSPDTEPEKGNSPQSLIKATTKEAIRLPPASLPSKVLSMPDLQFGEQQVERMVRDRSEMLRYVKKGDPVWKYCARAFAGEAIGQRVYWDSTLPESQDTAAEHLGPIGGDKGFIRVRKVYASGPESGTPLTCEELWSGAVYELENIRGTKAFDQLYNMALAGRLTREQWIRENTRLEYAACQRTAKLYRNLWLPAASARGIPSSGSAWFADAPGTYEAWIAGYTDPNSYPWSDWGKYYDEQITPYVRSLERQ